MNVSFIIKQLELGCTAADWSLPENYFPSRAAVEEAKA
jgi:hypothetical protein